MSDVPPIPEPKPVAEAGVTTSEWTLITRYLVQLAAVGTATVIGRLGGHVDGVTLGVIVGLEVTGASAVIGYAYSRGIRKAGTSG